MKVSLRDGFEILDRTLVPPVGAAISRPQVQVPVL